MRRAVHFLCLSCLKSLTYSLQGLDKTLVGGEDRSTDDAAPQLPLPSVPTTTTSNTMKVDSQVGNRALATAAATSEVDTQVNNEVINEELVTSPTMLDAAPASPVSVSQVTSTGASGTSALIKEKIVPRWVRVSLLDPDLCSESAMTDHLWHNPGIQRSYYGLLHI